MPDIKDHEPITFGGQKVGRDDETRPFLIVGRDTDPVLDELIAGSAGRGDDVVVADISGRRSEKHYDPERDMIVNPGHAGSARWNALAEIDSRYDAQALGRALIPNAPELASPSFPRIPHAYNDARRYTSALAMHLVELGRRARDKFDDKSLLTNTSLRKILSAPLQRYDPDLKTMLDDSEGWQILMRLTPRERTAANTIIEAHTGWLDDMEAGAGREFSMKARVAPGGSEKGGVIFLQGANGNILPARRMIPALMKMGMHHTLERRPDADARRTWFMANLRTIGQIDDLAHSMALLGRHNGRVAVAIDSIGEVQALYGQPAVEQMTAQRPNVLILGSRRGMDRETAEYAGALIAGRKQGAALADRIAHLPENLAIVAMGSGGDWRTVTVPHRKAVADAGADVAAGPGAGFAYLRRHSVTRYLEQTTAGRKSSHDGSGGRGGGYDA